MSGRRVDPHAVEASEPGPAFTVLSGDPTPAELAAVTAVLAAMAQESTDDAVLESGTSSRAWQRGTGALRTPIVPGPGAWRGFAG